MQHDRLSGSPSRIPSFSPTPAESVPSSACLKPCNSNACPDIVGQLLDELISAAAFQAAGEQQSAPLNQVQLPKGSSYDDSSRGSGARRSAITALREGIDARCDEPASIEAMEALDSTAEDSLLVPSPFKSVPQHKGSTLQELADMYSAGFGTEALEVEGPADSWLRASGDLSASGAAPAGAQSNLALNTHGPSWDDYVTNMDTKLLTAACHAPLVPAVASSSSAQATARSASAAAVLRTAPAAMDAAAAPNSSSSLQGSPKSSQRTAPVLNASLKTAAAARSGRSSPKPAAASAGSRAVGGYATARTPVRNSPRSPSPAGKPGVAASPRSPGSAALVPAPLRTRIPQQQQQQQQQSPQEQERALDRSDSLSRSGSSRIPSALSPLPQQLQQQQQAAVTAVLAAADVNSVSLGTGLDVLLSGTHRRSSSDNGSSASSRRGSMAGAGPRDEASAAWMSSLRSAGPSSTGSKRTSSRGSSAAGTPPISTRTSSKQLHSNRSARMTAQALEAAAVPPAALSTPPAGIKSSRSIRTTPRSSVDGSLSKHAHLSLRRSGSLRSSSVSPTAAVARAGSARVLSPGAAAVPLPLAFEAAAAAEVPTGRQRAHASPAAAARAGHQVSSYSSARDSSDGAVMMRLSEPGSDNWLTGRAASSDAAAAAGSLISTGGGSELLTSDHEIMADPTAVQLFMELNEEIEAEGRAAMAAAEAAAAAKSDAAAAAAAAVSSPAAQVRSGPDSGAALAGARTSSGGVSAQVPPAGEASWGSGGADDKQSTSPEPSRRNTQSDAASPEAADLAAVPAAVDEARVSNTVDNRASLGHETAAAPPEPAVKALGADSSAVAVASAGAAAAVPAGKASVSERLQAAYDGESDLRDEEDAADQPSCGCKCVIM